MGVVAHGVGERVDVERSARGALQREPLVLVEAPTGGAGTQVRSRHPGQGVGEPVLEARDVPRRQLDVEGLAAKTDGFGKFAEPFV